MKIPFERTIASAYGFAFSNILSVFGIAWFPYLLFVAIIAALLHFFGPQLLAAFGTVTAQQKPDPMAFLAVMRMFFIAYAAVLPALLVISAMVTVGVMRKALGQRPGPVFFYFSLGAPVWRLIGAYFLLFLIFYGGAIAIGAGLFALYAVLDAQVQKFALPALIILGIVLACGAFYALVTTSFFVPAVVVAEDRIGLGRSWSLGRGNFWRIIGIMLIVAMPVSLAAQTILSSLLQWALGPDMVNMQAEAASPEQAQDVIKTMMAAAVKVGPYFVVVQIVQMVLLHGLNAGAVATAYRAVTGESDMKASG